MMWRVSPDHGENDVTGKRRLLGRSKNEVDFSSAIRELAGAKPLAAWRHHGLWPHSYDRLLGELVRRHGQPGGTRQMIQVLSLIKAHGHEWVRAAVEEAIALGCADAAAIRHLVEAVDLAHARSELIEVSELLRFERPLPVMTDYDGLLGQEVAS